LKNQFYNLKFEIMASNENRFYGNITQVKSYISINFQSSKDKTKHSRAIVQK